MSEEWREWLTPLEIPEGKAGTYEVSHTWIEAGKRIATANNRHAIIGGQAQHWVTFPERNRRHKLTYDGGTWMSDLPMEMAQHQRELRNFVGQVLVGGLGLGYAVHLLAHDEDVDRVVVVERSPEVIRLVAEHVQDPRSVVEVVEDDLFHYVETSGEWFHRAFFDIWQSDGETTLFDTVLPLRRLARTHDLVDDAADDVVCWNEDVMRGQLYHGLVGKMVMCKDQVPGTPRTPAEVLDYLCTEPADAKVDRIERVGWAVPFFRAAREHGWVRMDPPDFMPICQAYAAVYGMPGWADRWPAIVERFNEPMG